MVTGFLVVQVAVNLALILGVFRLLRERDGRAALAAAREARLEALAAEFCALGREVARGVGAASAPAASSPAASVARTALHSPDGPLSAGSGRRPGAGRSSERLRAAALLLDRGLPVGAVASRTALPEGEVQVLRNLRRCQTLAGPVRQRRGVASVPEPALPPASEPGGR
jgi:hypothetical protein